MNYLTQIFNRFKANSILIYCLQILIVLTGTTLGLLWLGHNELIVTVTLGAIAAALTDFDDRLSLRLRNLLYVCLLFFTVSTILGFLAPYKLLFILYLSISSACFILLGALGQRYATISFGTILLSIYSMFGLGEYAHWYQQPTYFVYGALWYGLTSILFFLLKPTLPLQDKLSQIFEEISALLQAKARLFDPDNKENVEQLLFELSLQNTQVAQSLNQIRSSLLTRLKASRVSNKSIYWLNLYFFARDIHEQATSNYLHYEHIQQNFSRSDLIFRFQKNLRLQAQACHDLAQCILHNQQYQSSQEGQIVLNHLESSLKDWIQQHPQNFEVKNLKLIFNNLKGMHEQFEQLQYAQPFNETLSQHGYWILLTSLFVCQITYFATKSRLKLRTIGTLLGVLWGIPILYFVPSIEGQLILTIICGVSFFYLRQKKYALATLMATLMVLLIFNLKGAGFSIILPRLIDTLLGCFIAWLAVNFIWPDWNFRNIPNNIKKSSQATLDYFNVIVEQYQHGKNQDIEYRRIRRAAHNAQIELSNMISSLSAEPNPKPELIHYAFRYLVYSHSQLSYVAALGSQRQKIEDQQVLQLLLDCQQILNQSLFEQVSVDLNFIEQTLKQIQSLTTHEDFSESYTLVLKQMSLLLETLPELLTLKNKLLEQEIK